MVFTPSFGNFQVALLGEPSLLAAWLCTRSWLFRTRSWPKYQRMLFLSDTHGKKKRRKHFRKNRVWRAKDWFCLVCSFYMCRPSNSAGTVWDDETLCLLCTASTSWLNRCDILIFTLLTVSTTWNHEYSPKCVAYIYIPCGFVSDCPRLIQNKKHQEATLQDLHWLLYLNVFDNTIAITNHAQESTYTHTHQNLFLGLGGCNF